MSNLTRIKNNQITDSTILANVKIVPGSIVGSLFNSNLTMTSDVTITGNLTVQGSSTYLTLASTNTYVNDPLIVMNNAFAGTNTYDIGFLFNRGNQTNQAIIWNEDSDEFRLIATNETGTTFGNIAATSWAKLHLGDFASEGSATFANVDVTAAFTGVGLTLSGDLGVNGGDFTSNAATFNLLTADVTTINAFTAATTANIGAGTGTFTINTPTIVGQQATQNLYNTVATTMNFAGAATTLNLGANSGLLALNNANIWVPNATSIDGAQATVDLLRNATTVSAFTSASTANIGAGAGTLTINNPTVVGQQTSQNLYNSVATTMNFAGDATTLNLGATSGTAQIKNANLYLPNATTIYTGQTTVDFAAATTTLNIGAATGTTNVKNNLDVDLTLNARDINNTVIGNITPATGKFTSVYSTSLTEGRVVFTGSGNVLADASQLTYDTGTWQLSVGPIYIYGGGNGIGTTSGDLNITPAGNIIASNNSIKWMLDPVDAQDAVTLSYLQTSLNSSVTQIISDNTDVVITDDGVSSGVITANVDGVHVLAVTSNSAAFFGNTSADSLIFADYTTGNVAVMGDLYIQDDLTVASGGQVSILDTTASTDTTTGALKITGGVGVGGNLNVGANLFVVSDATVAGAVKFSNTADATNSTTGGALTVSGGLAVAKNVFIGQSLEITGNLTVQGTTTTLNTATLDVEDLNITVAKGAASSAAADGAGLTVDGANATLLYTDGTSSWDLNKITRVTATTAATDNVTGALQILGGAGIAQSLYARDINATVIGNTSAAAGTFTALTSSGTTQLGLTSATAINNTPIGNATASSGAFTTLDASGIVQFTNASAATSVGTGALRVTGGASVGGNLYVGGNINIVGNTFTLTGNIGVFYGDINGFGALYAGVTGYTSLPQTVLQTQGDYNGYIQNNFENVNTGALASTDWVATAGDGSDFDHYIDMGITTVNWDGTQENSITNAVGPNDGYLYVQGNITTGQGGNLTIGASTSGTKKVSILAGGNTASSISAVFTNPGTPSTNTTTGALTLVGGLGVFGNINANNISATTLTGTLSTASQPNVTSLGTLSSLSISGVLTAGNTAVASLTMSASGNANITGVNDLSTQTVTASGNISAGNVSATYFTGTLLTAAQPNVTSLGNLTSLSASGTIETTGIVYGNSGVGGTLLTAAQPNVTSLGNLTSLSASGTIETIGTIYANSTAVSYSSATGALVVAGGVGLGANLNVHGGAVINIDNTLEPFQVKGKYANTLIYADSVTDTVTIGGGNTTPINGATLRVNGTGAMVVPKGTTSERPGTAGNVDVAGMVRFNTSTNILEYYTGSAWQNTSTDFTVIAVDAFTGNGAQTNFTLAAASTTAGALVAINGVVQIPTTSYSISGNVLSFTEAPAVGDEIDVRRYTTSKTITEVLFLYNGFQANASHATVSTGTSSYNPRILVDTSGKTTLAGDVEKQGDVINNQTVTNIPLSAAAVVVDQFSTGTYTSAKYLAQVKDGATNAAHIFDLLVIHDTSTANLLVVSSHNTGSSLGSFTANIQSGTVKLWYTSASVTNSNVRVAATYVK